MLNVTDHYCISPAISKGGFSCHPGDLSRKCHLCHGSCTSQKRGIRPPSSHYKTVKKQTNKQTKGNKKFPRVCLKVYIKKQENT